MGPPQSMPALALAACGTCGLRQTCPRPLSLDVCEGCAGGSTCPCKALTWRTTVGTMTRSPSPKMALGRSATVRSSPPLPFASRMSFSAVICSHASATGAPKKRKSASRPARPPPLPFKHRPGHLARAARHRSDSPHAAPPCAPRSAAVYVPSHICAPDAAVPGARHPQASVGGRRKQALSAWVACSEPFHLGLRVVVHGLGGVGLVLGDRVQRLAVKHHRRRAGEDLRVGV